MFTMLQMCKCCDRYARTLKQWNSFTIQSMKSKGSLKWNTFFLLQPFVEQWKFTLVARILLGFGKKIKWLRPVTYKEIREERFRFDVTSFQLPCHTKKRTSYITNVFDCLVKFTCHPRRMILIIKSASSAINILRSIDSQKSDLWAQEKKDSNESAKVLLQQSWRFQGQICMLEKDWETVETGPQTVGARFQL